MWWSANARPAPKRIVEVDDQLTAVAAVKYASQGVAMLWRGDYQNARQILSAIDRRLTKTADEKTKNPKTQGRNSAEPVLGNAQGFYKIRQGRAQRSRVMSLLLIPITVGADGQLEVPLPRAPKLGAVLGFGYGDQPGYGQGAAVISLQELIGIQSAHQWFLKGVDVPSLGAKIYPHYGTFLPTRHEYVDLVAHAPLPSLELAFDIGTGTGVLAAVLAERGVKQILGTDIHQRAVDCAMDNFMRLGISDRASAQLTNMFPPGRAPLIICNPPWLPGSATSTLDAAVYDPASQMLLQFLGGLSKHLTEDGEGWLILSDLAELLGLRNRQMLLDAIAQAGLEVIDRLDTVPSHGRSKDSADLLYQARSKEVTSLWRLRVGPARIQ